MSYRTIIINVIKQKIELKVWQTCKGHSIFLLTLMNYIWYNVHVGKLVKTAFSNSIWVFPSEVQSSFLCFTAPQRLKEAMQLLKRLSRTIVKRTLSKTYQMYCPLKTRLFKFEFVEEPKLVVNTCC